MSCTVIDGFENTIKTTENEEKKVIIDIEGSTNDTNKCTEMGHVKEIKKTDTAPVIIQTEQESDPLEYGDKNPKPPEIWIQYILDSGRRRNNDRRPHFREDYAGAPLDYDPENRNFFIKFVFMILLIMLTATFGFNILVLTNPVLKDIYIKFGMLIMISSLVVLVGLNYTMACSQCTRMPPFNYICLFIAVIAMSNMVSAVTVVYRTHILLFAFLATAALVAVCVLLACSRFDFTKWYLYVVGVIVAFSVIAMGVSIAMLLFNVKYKPVQLVMLFVGGILNVIVLIMELQMVIGGKSIELSEHDYALAAYMLYMSIMDLFLKIVGILGVLDDK